MSFDSSDAEAATVGPPLLRQPGQVAYQALAEKLRGAIGSGEFSSGRRLPTEAELSDRYGLSRQTVRRALQDLVAEGLVFRVRGRGTYATPHSSGAQYLRSLGSIDDLLALSVDTTMELIRPLERRADVDAASRLKLPSDQVMAVLVRRFHEAVPFCVSQVSMPLDIGRLVIEADALPPPGQTAAKTIIGVVDEVSPERIVGANQSITAASVPAELGALIECEPGQPVLRVDRLYFDAKGRAVELGVSHFNPTRYSYRVELRRGPRPSAARE